MRGSATTMTAMIANL